MKRVKKMIGSAFMAALLIMMMTTVAYAEETGSLWLSISKSSDGKGTEAVLVTDTTVTDGLVKLTYDSTRLTYQGITVNEDYVAMYAVNADEEGEVKISWVAPEAFESDGDGISLIQVNFAGTAGENAFELTGKVQDASGNEIVLGDVDTTALEKAIADAKNRRENEYTEKSYGDMKAALAAAENVLSDPTATQKEVDAAAKALNDAIKALVKKPSSGNTSGNTDKNPSGTEGTGTGDNANIGLLVLVTFVCAAVIAGWAVRKKRGLTK